jgi:hypothetical protein
MLNKNSPLIRNCGNIEPMQRIKAEFSSLQTEDMKRP